MLKWMTGGWLWLAWGLCTICSAEELSAKIDAGVQQRAERGWEAACQIWDWAEPGYQEHRSSALLADWLEGEGFQVERGVAEIPTAFTATIGSGSPVIAILGEYDALPGLAQSAVPYRDAPAAGYYGQGCGHHLFGVASAMAALSLGEQIRSGKLPGTVRYYGCPAEEGGSAKAFLVRAGLFSDVDVALHWHPSNQNSAGDRSSLARIAVKFRFHGVSAHAAGAPEQGRSALDAVELTNHATQLLREHTPEGTRIHHVITSGGDAPNVVPNFAEVYYYVRHPRSEVVRSLYERVVKCAQAGALATETRLEIVSEGGIAEILPNTTLAEVCLKHLEQLNDLRFPDELTEFALRLQQTLEKPRPLDDVQFVYNKSGEVGMGSTDVGDVSWVVPTTGFGTACWVPGTPGHSWQAVACGRTEIARRGMVLAARVLAATGHDLLTRPALVTQAKQEHAQRIGQRAYVPLIEPDQPPPLNYRNRPTRSISE
jgi:aminobenzoyl-glutamate utilization protein B